MAKLFKRRNIQAHPNLSHFGFKLLIRVNYPSDKSHLDTPFYTLLSLHLSLLIGPFISVIFLSLENGAPKGTFLSLLKIVQTYKTGPGFKQRSIFSHAAYLLIKFI